MSNRLPHIFSGSKICIICEGDEEFYYLDKLISLKVWSETYKIDLVNAEGNGNIPARYQDRYQNGIYDLVLVFCDTEKKPYEQYEDIKRKINEFHGNGRAAGQVVIFTNPCTMQIIIAHWSDVKLKTPAKKVNRPLIFELTGIKDYKAKKDQLNELALKITLENYNQMTKRIDSFSINDNEIGSSNFKIFIERFSNDDTNWIDEINDIIDETD